VAQLEEVLKATLFSRSTAALLSRLQAKRIWVLPAKRVHLE
jgi:hypothetical protein